jgi:hypothetical protein
VSLAIDPVELVRSRFLQANIPPTGLEVRAFPGETIIVVRVSSELLEKASTLGNSLDKELALTGFNGFVTVRPSDLSVPPPTSAAKQGVLDPRAAELVTLLTARSRTSEIQPSLSYIRDTSENIGRATAPRHHLVFGRRGAGKTALMVEAKRLITERGDIAVWENVQTYRRSSAAQAVVGIGLRICEQVQLFYQDRASPAVLAEASTLAGTLTSLTALETIPSQKVNPLIPRMQRMLQRFTTTSAVNTYVFLDDLHYLERDSQPLLLDMLHGAIRDAAVWLKIAGIKHLSNWFQPHPPIGLQTGHDADHIDLDVTLENPAHAKQFLEKMLSTYAEKVGIRSLSNILSAEALDRLVLASGAVPRDYLVLCADAIQEAQKREKARTVGVQDVNKAAGNAAKVKLTELEDDAASAGDLTAKVLDGLRTIRRFCIDERSSTYFRVDFRDKENHSDEYAVLQELLDLRLTHLVDGSLSDEKHAGHRSEVYMLDLSQFSGQRLKRKLKVLDFEAGYLVLKATGTKDPHKIGSTPNQRLGILRRGPLFELAQIGEKMGNGNEGPTFSNTAPIVSASSK